MTLVLIVLNPDRLMCGGPEARPRASGFPSTGTGFP